MRYVVTGGTGFIGRRVVSALLARNDDPEVWVLVRRESLSRFERLAEQWGERAKPLVGDLTAARPRALRGDRRRTRRRRPRRALRRDLRRHRRRRGAARRQRRRHQRGDRPAPSGWTPRFTTCRRSRWRARSPASTPRRTSTSRRTCRRRITRPSSRPRCWCAPRRGCGMRVYRPAVVVGDSRTGEMDKIDGPYYFFGLLAKLAVLPRLTPMHAARHRPHQRRPGGLRRRRARRDHARPRPRRPDVPPDRAEVDRAQAHLPRRGPGGRAAASCAARCRGRWRRRSSRRRDAPRSCATWRPPSSASPRRSSTSSTSPRRSPRTTPAEALRDTGIRVPEFSSYAPAAVAVLGRAPRPRPGPPRRSGGPAGRPPRRSSRAPRAASGGRRRSPWPNAARRCSRWPATARRSTTSSPRSANPAASAYAFTCDVTDSASVDHTVKDILGQFGHVDYLVNNAGPVDPPVGVGVDRPTARLRTRDGRQLLRFGADGARAAAALARAPLRPRRERVERGRAGQQPEVQRLHPEQGGARRVRRSGWHRDAFGPHHVHQHPHAAGGDADDRAVAQAQPDAADHRRPRRRDGGARSGRQARPDRHAGRARWPTLGMYFTPKLSRRMLHQVYLGYPDSAAARGVAAPEPTTPVAHEPTRRPKRPARAAATSLRAPRSAQARRAPGPGCALVGGRPYR